MNRVVGLGSCRDGWQHGGMLISSTYRLTRKILSTVATIARRDVSSDADERSARQRGSYLGEQLLVRVMLEAA